MSCSRKGCENIMCDTYIDGAGYICYECKSEFNLYLRQLDNEVKYEGGIKRELIKFMDTEKDEFVKGEVISVDDFFSKYTS